MIKQRGAFSVLITNFRKSVISNTKLVNSEGQLVRFFSWAGPLRHDWNSLVRPVVWIVRIVAVVVAIVGLNRVVVVVDQRLLIWLRLSETKAGTESS